MQKPPSVPALIPLSRRWRWTTGVVIAGGVYAGLVAAYAFGGGTAGTVPIVSAPPGGVAVLLSANAVDASDPALSVDVRLIVDSRLLDAQGAPREPITVVVGETRDGADLTWPAGRSMDNRQTSLELDGDIQGWPFDVYTGAISAQSYTGQGVQSQEISTRFTVAGDVQGWHLAASPGPVTPGRLSVRIHRTIGIIASGMLLVAVMVLMPYWHCSWSSMPIAGGAGSSPISSHG